jgi:hypothetical protein
MTTPEEESEGAMNSRLCIFALGLLLLTQPALANDEDTKTWDLNIASAVHAAMIRDEKTCQSNPYGLYRRGCGDRELSVDFDEDEGPRLTMLDRVALFVYKYKDLNLDADLRPNTKFKFTMSLANLYEQEAKARVELRIRW